jgi:hypothetical protein
VVRDITFKLPTARFTIQAGLQIGLQSVEQVPKSPKQNEEAKDVKNTHKSIHNNTSVSRLSDLQVVEVNFPGEIGRAHV